MQETKNSPILQKKKKVGIFILLNFKTYDNVSVMKIIWYWHKERYIDQRNRIENPEINRYIYGQLIRTIEWGMNSLFNKQC